MSYGNLKVFPTIVAASGASTSSGLDLGGRAWSKVGVYVGSMSTGQAVSLWHATASGSAYVRSYMIANSGATQANPISIQTAAVENGGYVVLPEGPYSYIKFVMGAVVSGGVSYTVVASD